MKGDIKPIAILLANLRGTRNKPTTLLNMSNYLILTISTVKLALKGTKEIYYPKNSGKPFLLTNKIQHLNYLFQKIQTIQKITEDQVPENKK